MRHDFRQTILHGVLAAGMVLTAGVLTARAQNFIANPNSLFFAVQVNSIGNPQQISLTSSGTNLNFTATASVTTPAGFAWLSVSSGSSTTPATLNVSVNVFGLAPNNNNYTGTITIRQVGGPATLTIPIDLNVFGDRFLRLDNSSLTYITPVGSSPDAQQVIVSADGSHTGPLAFRTLIATNGGGDWITLSPSQGTTPATLNVSVHPGNLSAGDYSGTVTIADTANNTVVLQVFMLLNTRSTIKAAPSSLTFSMTVGASPPSQALQITNTGSGTLNWAASPSTVSGGNWLGLSAASGTAPSTVSVSVNATSLSRGAYNGSVTITATGATNSPLVVPVVLGVGVPLVYDNGVLNGASFASDAVVSSLSIVSLFGQQLATDVFTFSTVPLPPILGGTQVLVNDTPAPLFAVSPNQINFQMPAGLNGTSATVAVSLNGVRGPNSTIKLAAATPGIFTLTQNGSGPGAVLNQDFTVNSAANPEARGRVLQIYATGLGATNPPIAAGQAAATTLPFNETVATPIVMIGNIAAQVQFSAMAPGYVGLYQVNAFVPQGVSTGNAVPVQIQVGGVSSNVATVAIR
jgi:uncharacterized protein (TIGR03437 family)